MIVVVDVTNTPLKLSAQRKWRRIFSELSETEFMLADKVCFPSCLNIVLMSRVDAKIPSGQILFRSVLVSGNINYILLHQPPCIVIFFMWIPIQQILLDFFQYFSKENKDIIKSGWYQKIINYFQATSSKKI